MNWFEYLEIFLHRNDFATSNQFYSNAIMQKLEIKLKIHSQLEHVFVWTFRNFFASKSFRNYKQIDQSENQNYIQCENVEFEKFSTMYDDLSRIRNASMQKRENVMKIFIQIKFGFFWRFNVFRLRRISMFRSKFIIFTRIDFEEFENQQKIHI